MVNGSFTEIVVREYATCVFSAAISVLGHRAHVPFTTYLYSSLQHIVLKLSSVVRRDRSLLCVSPKLKVSTWLGEEAHGFGKRIDRRICTELVPTADSLYSWMKE